MDKFEGEIMYENHDLSSLNVLNDVIKEFMDTPYEEPIIKFKNMICNNHTKYNEWFKCQTTIIQIIGEKSFPEDWLFK